MHSTTLFSLRTWSLGMNTLLPPEISININSSSALDELNLRHEAFLDHMKKITVVRFSLASSSPVLLLPMLEPPLGMTVKTKAWWVLRCCTNTTWGQSMPSTAWNISYSQHPAQLTLCHYRSSAASLYDLNSSLCSPCDHQHGCTKFLFSTHS